MLWVFSSVWRRASVAEDLKIDFPAITISGVHVSQIFQACPVSVS